MSRRVVLLSLAAPVLLAAGPSGASAGTTCPTSRFGRDADLLHNQPLQPVAGQPYPFEVARYGSSPLVPGVAFGTNRGFGDALYLARGAGAVEIDATAPLPSGPAMLAARVGPSSDPAELPAISLDWRDEQGAVLSTQVARPQPCPERDRDRTVWRTLTAVVRPPGATAFRVRISTPAGTPSFLSGLSLSSRPGSAELLAPRRSPALRLRSVRREADRLVLAVSVHSALLRRIRLRVAGSGRVVRTSLAAPQAPGPFPQATQVIRLPRGLRRGRLVVTASYPGDGGFAAGRAVRVVRPRP